MDRKIFAANSTRKGEQVIAIYISNKIYLLQGKSKNATVKCKCFNKNSLPKNTFKRSCMKAISIFHYRRETNISSNASSCKACEIV